MAKSKIDYDLKEASWKFITLKVIEIGIILIFLFGFYYLGLWVNNNLSNKQCNLKLLIDIPCPHVEKQTLFSIWSLGVLFAIEIIFVLVIWALIIGLIIGAIYLFITLNWEKAKRMAETPESKKRNAIEYEKRLRDRWIILEGDLVEVKQNLKINEKYGNIKFVKRMKPFEGAIAKVIKMDDYDHTYKLKFMKDQEHWWTVPMLKISKRRENPFYND